MLREPKLRRVTFETASIERYKRREASPAFVSSVRL
jgi:transposase-like protein